MTTAFSHTCKLSLSAAVFILLWLLFVCFVILLSLGLPIPVWEIPGDLDVVLGEGRELSKNVTSL